eukprot:XP_003632437.2 PREDICTED: cysteine-rich receptor-like protein kinase 10 isoform X1 [Vitis vinifera]
MRRGEKMLVSCRLSCLKFLLIMILLIVVYQFASIWGFTSGNPWLWNSATTATLVTRIPTRSYGGALIQQPRPAAIAINAARNYWWLWITISGLVILMLLVVLFCYRRKLKGKKEEEAMLHELTTFDRSIDLDENGNNGNHGHKLKVFNFDYIMIATNNFSSQNKIGKGGFGDVYKGKLIDGQEIAVKRLSRGSGQGLVEFKNEIRLISNLQHMNIIRLIGCSISGEERILIYEFMPNKSLDFFLFDARCKKLLDWKKRYNIIEGIAQGLLYLHKYSRLRIIHRDLKASNILLDHDMNPKISDFGMARIVRPNAIEANTERIVGTIGYMSPEYARNGIFSMKSDVYSFGVLMLEIISGRKNKIFHHNDCTINLVGYAWDLWKERRSLELVDPELGVSNSTAQMLRCIHVAMLCVQGNAANRPTVSDAIFMLTNETVPLPTPTLPIAAVNHTGGLGSCATSLTISEMEAR